MLCWPLSLEIRKFTQARPDSAEKVCINKYLHINRELTQCYSQYSWEINYHATHTNRDMLR